MSRARVFWSLFAATGIGAYLLARMEFFTPIANLIAAYYSLFVAFMVFAAVAITLTVRLGLTGRKVDWIDLYICLW
jgi:hypothetical protein